MVTPTQTSTHPAGAPDALDAIVVGAGFAGCYLLHRLRDELGLSVRVLEAADDVGGTWYWNRYPGARCDVPSVYYSFSFDENLDQEWRWTERYATQPEILAYIQHVATRYDLRRDIDFGTTVVGARFDERSRTWTVDTDDGRHLRARFLITAVGCLSATQLPRFEGLESFAGDWYHTGRWPHEGVDFTGKRVGVIGTGSSGIQVIPMIAEDADHLTVFQRTPTFTVPAHNRPLTEAELEEVANSYPELRKRVLTAWSGTPKPEPIGSAHALTEQERQEELDRRWAYGGSGFTAAFSDTLLDLEANEVAAEYVRSKIKQIVHDPEVAELLTPRDYPIGTKRLAVDTGYYATYNRPNVSLVDVREKPIRRITPDGILVGDTSYPLDAIVFATGYDALTGAILRLGIRGADSTELADKWAEGPKTYLGLMTAGFPNLFMVTAPGSPSVMTNMVMSIEQHVEWITDLVAKLTRDGITRVEPDVQAEEEWVTHINELAAETLFPGAASWYMGANIPGKPRVFMPYVGGAPRYREVCARVAAEGYSGFILDARPDVTCPAPAVVTAT